MADDFGARIDKVEEELRNGLSQLRHVIQMQMSNSKRDTVTQLDEFRQELTSVCSKMVTVAEVSAIKRDLEEFVAAYSASVAQQPPAEAVSANAAQPSAVSASQAQPGDSAGRDGQALLSQERAAYSQAVLEDALELDDPFREAFAAEEKDKDSSGYSMKYIDADSVKTDSSLPIEERLRKVEQLAGSFYQEVSAISRALGKIDSRRNVMKLEQRVALIEQIVLNRKNGTAKLSASAGNSESNLRSGAEDRGISGKGAEGRKNGAAVNTWEIDKDTMEWG